MTTRVPDDRAPTWLAQRTADLESRGHSGSPADYRSGLTVIPGASDLIVAVGPTGSELSKDGGTSWSPIGSESFHAVRPRVQMRSGLSEMMAGSASWTVWLR